MFTRALAASAVLLSLAACGSQADGSDPVVFHPKLKDDLLVGLLADVTVDGVQLPHALVDTGSPYAMASTKHECAQQQQFFYGSGPVSYCPTDGEYALARPDGSKDLLDVPLRYGATDSFDLIGLTGNVDPARNQPAMTSVLEQLRPEAMTFTFPDGERADGELSFAPYTGAGVEIADVQLRDPGVLGYGFVSELRRLEYLVDGEVHTTIETRADGVWLRSARQNRRVADEFLAFFDTGTTAPSLLMMANVPLTAPDVASNNPELVPPSRVQLFDGLRMTFADVDGREVSLTQSEWPRLGDEGAIPLRIPRTQDIPPTTRTLVDVTGLNFLARYDFEFTYSDGVATDLKFFSRVPTSP